MVLLDLSICAMGKLMIYILADSNNRIYNFIAFVGMVFTYFPERHNDIHQERKMVLLRRVDWIGALLSFTGITLL